MNKTLIFSLLLVLIAVFFPQDRVLAQACCSMGYQQYPQYYQYPIPTYTYFNNPGSTTGGQLGNGTNYYQYPIPLYTYFETPNSTARNYTPTNYPGSTYSYVQPNQNQQYGFQMTSRQGSFNPFAYVGNIGYKGW